jgi:hypothetical protein
MRRNTSEFKRYFVQPETLGDVLKEGIGAARGIRTPDPIITNDVLYQLSYCGVRGGSNRRVSLSHANSIYQARRRKPVMS